MRTDRSLVRAISDHEHESADHPVFGTLLWRTAYDIIQTEEKLIAKARSIAGDMTGLVLRFKKAERRPYFNSLGELQSQGPEFDRLCGVLDMAYENFNRLYAAWDYTMLHKPDRPGTEE